MGVRPRTEHADVINVKWGCGLVVDLGEDREVDIASTKKV